MFYCYPNCSLWDCSLFKCERLSIKRDFKSGNLDEVKLETFGVNSSLDSIPLLFLMTALILLSAEWMRKWRRDSNENPL